MENSDLTWSNATLNVYQDIALVHYELKEWDLCIKYSELLKEQVLKVVNRTYAASAGLNLAQNMIKESNAQKALEAMNPVSRLHKKHPYAFYGGVATLVSGLGVLGYFMAKKH